MDVFTQMWNRLRIALSIVWYIMASIFAWIFPIVIAIFLLLAIFCLGCFVIYSIWASGTAFVFSKICRIPFISDHLDCANYASEYLKQAKLPDLPQALEKGVQTYTQIRNELFSEKNNESLIHQISMERLAIRDLRISVLQSNMLNRDAIAKSIFDIVETSKIAEDKMQRAAAKAKVANENLESYSESALKSLKEGKQIFTDETMMNLEKSYSSLFDDVSYDLKSVIEAFVSTSTTVIDLEAKLENLLELVMRENKDQSGKHKEILGSFWTLLWGNKKIIKEFEENLLILKNLESNRREYDVKVTNAGKRLKDYQFFLEEVRDRMNCVRYKPGMIKEWIAKLGATIKMARSGFRYSNENENVRI